MKNLLRKPRWSPYIVGALIGVLSWTTFYFMDKPLGASTTAVRTVGMVEGAISEEHVRSNSYLTKYLVGKPAIEWQFALVLMLPLGSLIAATLAKSHNQRAVPTLWASRFGASKAKRYLGAVLGGAILMFGARLAGGCTSGHGISGGLQLAVSSWAFFASMFASGIATAMLFYRVKGGDHV